MDFPKDRIYPPTPHQWADMPASFSTDELEIGGWQVMQRWELPLMKVLAEAVTAVEGDVLEIGFGMGICANEIARKGCRTYAVIEAHPVVAEAAREWGAKQSFPVSVHEGLWQDVVPTLTEKYDGIVFDTFPLAPEERGRNHFAFIPIATELLNPSGVLTLYSDETAEFRGEHLSLLLNAFPEVRLVKVEGLRPPEDCEYWKHTSMVIPVGRMAGNHDGT
ncbi:MAG: class I SAM-dependent methyltransferase [Solirubrobacterales bacterium]